MSGSTHSPSTTLMTDIRRVVDVMRGRQSLLGPDLKEFLVVDLASSLIQDAKSIVLASRFEDILNFR